MKNVLRTSKHFCLCLILLMLSSCITVEDFGSYWSKGTVDTALLGTWGEWNPEHKNNILPVTITNNGSALRIVFLDGNGAIRKDQDSGAGRTLKAGNYTFLMTTAEVAIQDGQHVKGLLYRYKVEGDKIHVYSLYSDPMVEFLKRNYPKEENFIAKLGSPDCKHKCSDVSIKTLDAGVYKILSEIPDTPEFWVSSEISRHDASVKK